MRILVLALAASSLVLAGCGKKQATDNTSGLDQAITAQDFDANDATAIDAATGADANMAADVNYIDVPSDNSGSGNASPGSPRKAAAATAGAAPSNTAEPASTPPGNSVAGATTNNSL
jgi:hypothetical protein